MTENPWIEWKGGDCPVGLESIVAVKLRCGDKRESAEARRFRWAHFADPVGKQFDIIAYRVVQHG